MKRLMILTTAIVVLASSMISFADSETASHNDEATLEQWLEEKAVELGVEDDRKLLGVDEYEDGIVGMKVQLEDGTKVRFSNVADRKNGDIEYNIAINDHAWNDEIGEYEVFDISKSYSRNRVENNNLFLTDVFNIEVLCRDGFGTLFEGTKKQVEGVKQYNNTLRIEFDSDLEYIQVQPIVSRYNIAREVDIEEMMSREADEKYTEVERYTVQDLEVTVDEENNVSSITFNEQGSSQFALTSSVEGDFEVRYFYNDILVDTDTLVYVNRTVQNEDGSEGYMTLSVIPATKYISELRESGTVVESSLDTDFFEIEYQISGDGEYNDYPTNHYNDFGYDSNFEALDSEDIVEVGEEEIPLSASKPLMILLAVVVATVVYTQYNKYINKSDNSEVK